MVDLILAVSQPAGKGMVVAGPSARDAVDLVRAAVEATDVDRFVVVNGVSTNTHRGADLTEALRLGYRPQDDAWSEEDS